MADWSGNETQQTQNVSSSAPAIPEVTNTIKGLATGVQQAQAAGPKVFDETLYGGVGADTRRGWDLSTAAAMNPNYSSGVDDAIKSYSRVAAGDFLDGNDPAFQRDLSRTLDDTGADVNSFFGASGRLGSTPHVNDLVSSLGSVRDKAYMGERDRSRAYQTQAAQMLPSLYSAAQLPAATTGAVGSAKDADTQATLLGRNDLFRRQSDAMTDLLAKLTSISNGNAAAGGMTNTSTTTTPTVPWWQSGLSLAGQFI
jgi:hypothetical protein